MKELGQSIALYIPRRFAREAAEALSREAGGATILPGRGYWAGSDEPISEVRVYFEREGKTIDEVGAQVRRLLDAGEREVAVEVGGRLYLYD